MKNFLSKLTAGKAGSQTGHKAIQHQGNRAKSATHRYERRRIRELLRQSDGSELSFPA